MDSFVKDRSIITLVDQLRSRFGSDAFVIHDHWEADLCAIGLAARDEPARLVYISTFGKPEGRYDASLELPPASNDDFPYTPAGDRWDVDFEGLATLLGEHLGLE
jgi:hypothetical protein